MIPAVSFVLRAGDDLLTDLKFTLSGHYLSEMLVSELAPGRKLVLFQNCRLPRYVGIIRFSRGQQWLLDVVCDTTDIYRETPRHGALVTIVARDEATGERLAELFVEQHSARLQRC